MIEITLSCAQCGAELNSTMTVDKASAVCVESVRLLADGYGWIVQVNGDQVDTYCSKECAK